MILESWTDPAEGIFKYPVWWLGRSGEPPKQYEWVEQHIQGDRLRVRFAGIESPEQARDFVGLQVAVQRSELPQTQAGEFYQADLIGLKVRNMSGIELGVVEHFLATPANPVMVVAGERQRLLPVTRRHLQRVDLAEGVLWVDWPEDF